MPSAPSTGLVRVLTADDSPQFRATVGALIAATPGFEAISDADSGERAVELAAGLRPDLILLDVRMPGIGGIEALRRIRHARPAAVVVLISVDETDRLPADAWTCGASAIIRKDQLRPRLLTRLWERTAAGAPPRPLTPAEL